MTNFQLVVLAIMLYSVATTSFIIFQTFKLERYRRMAEHNRLIPISREVLQFIRSQVNERMKREKKYLKKNL